MTIIRKTIDALWPKGSAWRVAVSGFLDKLLDGISSGYQALYDFLVALTDIRNPFKTTLLSDLELEYGIPTDLRFTDEERRQRLSYYVYPGDQTGTDEDLQEALDKGGFGAGGFGLQVHVNDPPVDPAQFIDQAFQMVAGGDNAYAGFEPLGGPPTTAFAGAIGGIWVVNGDQFLQTPAYIMQAGGDIAYAGFEPASGPPIESVAGRFDKVNFDPIVYDTPTDPGDWTLTFFVGGDATRNIAGELTAIDIGQVPTERQNELKRLILKIKPLHTWCGLIVGFT